MKRILAGFVICLALVLIYRSWEWSGKTKAEIKSESALIASQIEQVSKLVVTEGHFAEVFSYADSRELFGPFFTADKRALVVVNARATVSYDLSELTYRLDSVTRTLYIEEIPEPEIRIDPDIEYYDVSADYFNPFGAEDYNRVKSKVIASIEKKIENSTLKSNARNRLLSELAEFYVLTRSLGWTLVYKDQKLESLPSRDLLLD
ncbi:MAG: DUF4230 domain-containing protein [Robiginitalea sp.]|uniref:DUF4230 domain-containing protein n=1 Tax=Robiginitalea sp. TaxID=1902411 RepID=UPI003C73FE97